MKTKPITLIVTLLFCLCGSVPLNAENQYESFVRVEKIEKKEADEYFKHPMHNFKDGAVVFYRKYITKTIKANRFRPFDKIEKLGYTYIATLRIKKSKDKDFKYSLYSYATDKEELFLKQLKCINMNKFTYDNSIANAIWKGDFYNKEKKKVGYYKVRLGEKSANITSIRTVIGIAFYANDNSYLGTIDIRTNSTYKIPKHKLVKNNSGIEVPVIPHPYSRSATTHQLLGSFKKIFSTKEK